ncbi:hypothetical protein GCM10007897_32070 [Sphingobium jiangsuense]|uniref:TP901 family phage tail tape measure protein n=1 Tax=Sphingobium jiangsuense TaxID=870476 RepID=A0A7W6FSQ7_9SPHN|nr:phage tail tape measure protein [Sphingobium jiangsuense]MBB3928319.1 TP901 family phage tail tape measure protein [Sphingobium jiangsuense]GLT01809.1 hypothetical protein GCM10007897_32070 [Sphingobium jiangsuense]
MARGQGQGVVLGYLRYILGFDALAFEEGLADAEKRMKAAERSIRKIGQKFESVGKSLTTYVTLPVAGAAAAILKMGGDFEASMNKVAISTEGSAAEMKAMNDLALKLGKDTVFGATDAADAMDELAKNGLSARQILDGAATAAVNLAAAAGSELSPAAQAVTDVMQQFKLTTDQLPDAVNQITGAVNQSKLDFSDFAQGIAQAGGVAGSVGVSFQDFNAVLASTSSLFASGSDAGTSFKSFLTALPGNSKQAIEAMKEYGLQFYDAQGNMRSMAEIAEELRTKLGGLNDQAKTNVLKTIFGTDAMRTAIGLMDQGAKGIDLIKSKIAETDAAAQSAQRLKGFNGQMEQLKGAVETLAITIAQSGLLEFVTGIVTSLGNFVDKLAEVNPTILKWGLILAGIAAVVGPVAVAIGVVVNALAPLVAMIGTAVTAAGGIGAVIAALAPPFLAVAAAVAAVWVAWKNWDSIGPVLSDIGSAIKDAIGPAAISMFEALKEAALALWNSAFMDQIRLIISDIAAFGKIIASVIGAEAPGVFRAFASAVSGVFNIVAEVIRAVVALLSGDFAGAWQHVQGAISAGVTAIRGVLGGLYDAAIAGVKALVAGISEWMGGKLDKIWEGAKQKIQSVADKFKWLWDVVVGHSYVPDMVDAIGANMARLKGLMVDPTAKATQTAAEAFRAMAGKIGDILDGLYPKASELREELEKLAILQADTTLDPNVRLSAIIKQQQRIAAARTAANDEVNPALVVPGLESAYASVAKAGQDAAAQLQAVNDNTGQSFVDMANTALNALSNLAQSIKNGGILDIMSNLFNAFGSLAKTGLLGSGLKATFTDFTGISGFRANGGPVRSGSSYVVGENGPELFTANRSGYIHPSAGNDNPRRFYFDLRGAVMTADLVAQMNRIGQTAAVGGALAGSQQAQSSLARRSRNRIP